MNRQFLFTIALTTTLIALAAQDAGAWGAMHAGYTHVGPGGVQHVGVNRVATPYGARATRNVSAVGPGGAYHAGVGAAYRPPAGGVVGGYRSGPVGYRAGVYRVR